jgi:hypothetical protein
MTTYMKDRASPLTHSACTTGIARRSFTPYCRSGFSDRLSNVGEDGRETELVDRLRRLLGSVCRHSYYLTVDTRLL